jgi:hypothetical protein
MTSDDPVIAALSDANPVARTVAPGPLERAEADRVLRQVMSSPPRSRHRPAVLVPVLSTLVVLAVVAVLVRSGGAGHSAAPSANAVNLTFQALPTAHTPVITPAAMAREVHVLRKRLASVQGSYRVTLASGDRIAVTSTNATSSTQARVVELVTERAELLFYDWEANALTPNGHTVASQLGAHNATALEISQGGAPGPGRDGSGSMSLYAAVSLAAKQPQAPISQHLSRIGAQYYMFGAPSSAGCAAVASAQHTIPIQRDHCLLAGPDDEMPAPPAGRRSTALSRSYLSASTAPTARFWLSLRVRWCSKRPARPGQTSRSTAPARSSSSYAIRSRCSGTRSPTHALAPIKPARPTSRSVSRGQGRTHFSASPPRSPTAAPTSARPVRPTTSTSQWRSTATCSQSPRSGSHSIQTASSVAAAPTSPPVSQRSRRGPSPPNSDSARYHCNFAVFAEEASKRWCAPDPASDQSGRPSNQQAPKQTSRGIPRQPVR